MRAEPLKLSQDEIELLKLAEESSTFIQHPLWRKVEIFLQANVEEAIEGMRGNRSSDPKVALHFERIWKERERLRDSLTAFVKGPIRDAKELMEQIEQAKKEGMIYA
jgi:hypothetical protein